MGSAPWRSSTRRRASSARSKSPSSVACRATAMFASTLVSLATITAGWIPHIGRQGLAVVVAASAWGGAIVGFGVATSLWLALLLLALAGAADQISAIFRSTMMLRLTPDHLRGRLAGIEFAQVAAAPSLGNLEAGVVASLTSLRFSIVSGGVACVAGCIAIAFAIPQLLRYDAKATRAGA